MGSIMLFCPKQITAVVIVADIGCSYDSNGL